MCVAFTRGVHAAGFDVARKAFGSSVVREKMTIYEIDPDRIGSFDVIVCGSLLLHLRDPLRALEAVRSACTGHFLSINEIRLTLSYPRRRRPIAELEGSGEAVRWWVPNRAGHERMLFAAGFAIEDRAGPFAIPFGPRHPTNTKPDRWRKRLLQRLLAGGEGVVHEALLATPRL